MGPERNARTHHRTTPARHHAAARKDRRFGDRVQNDLRWCKTLSHRRLQHNKRCGKILASEAKARPDRDLRWCKSLSHRRLSHGKKCRKLLAKEVRQHRTHKDHGWCKSLGYRQLVHNQACRKLLDRDARAARTDKRKVRARHSGTDKHRRQHRRHH
jgi:hypothetical protein